MENLRLAYISSFSEERKTKKTVFLCQSNNETHVYGFLFKVIDKTCLVPSLNLKFLEASRSSNFWCLLRTLAVLFFFSLYAHIS